MTIVAIAGSRALPAGAAPRLLVRFLASLEDGSTVLMRRGLFTEPGLFEAQVEAVCDLIGLKVEWCQPEPVPAHKDEGPKGSTVLGRRAVWARDVDMITRADVVVAFVDADQRADEESGTVQLVDKAIEHDKAVYSYAVWRTYGDEASGIELERIGENDPDGRWAELVPAG